MPAPTTDKAFSTATKVTWSGVATDDAADAYSPSGLAPLAASVQISGTFDSGTVTFEASNDGATFFGVKDTAGTLISATENGLFEFSSSAQFLKPVLDGAGGSADLDVSLVLRGQG
ncbi:MAG: hypothetical protein ACRBB0_15190 [Pelagimonas sp.]|uniref:hypothetical protein n=1 Tax=Pelagimonas sp. TaxID=2073170 RepID=UPI003D6A59F0